MRPFRLVYQGCTIDLANDWEGATACVVLSPSDVQCFDSEREMRGAIGEPEQPDKPTYAAAAACSGLVTLYDDEVFAGASLSFGTMSGWQNLTNYGFNDRMESWRNNRNCAAIIARDINGGGGQLALAASSSDDAVAANWKNQASSILD